MSDRDDEDLAAFMARAAARPGRGRRPHQERLDPARAAAVPAALTTVEQPPAHDHDHDHDVCHRELAQVRADLASARERLNQVERTATAALTTVSALPARPGHAVTCVCAVCRADLSRAVERARRGG